MRFLVFGAGAMGSLIGGLLAQQHDVTLVARSAHVEKLRRDGLRISGKTELLVRPRAVEAAAEADRPDAVIVAVKSYDTGRAMEQLAPFRESALFISLQNGLGNVEQLSAGAERVLGGVTYHGVTFVEAGEVIHAGVGDTILGAVQGASSAEAEQLAGVLSGCGLATTPTDDVSTVLWSKAVVNACFNPLTGLLGVKSGALGQSASLLECARLIVAEAVRVARAEGVRLEEDALMTRVCAVSEATAGNKSSMLQDLERGHRTEIDAINGWIARLGEGRGIDCPVNRTLTLLVQAAEERGQTMHAPFSHGSAHAAG